MKGGKGERCLHPRKPSSMVCGLIVASHADGFAEAAGGSHEPNPLKCTRNELVRI